jgi:hypothetical protein
MASAELAVPGLGVSRFAWWSTCATPPHLFLGRYHNSAQRGALNYTKVIMDEKSVIQPAKRHCVNYSDSVIGSSQFNSSILWASEAEALLLAFSILVYLSYRIVYVKLYGYTFLRGWRRRLLSL